MAYNYFDLGNMPISVYRRGRAMIADIYAALREFVKWAMEGWVGKSLGEQKRIAHSALSTFQNLQLG